MTTAMLFSQSLFFCKQVDLILREIWCKNQTVFIAGKSLHYITVFLTLQLAFPEVYFFLSHNNKCIVNSLRLERQYLLHYLLIVRILFSKYSRGDNPLRVDVETDVDVGRIYVSRLENNRLPQSCVHGCVVMIYIKRIYVLKNCLRF